MPKPLFGDSTSENNGEGMTTSLESNFPKLFRNTLESYLGKYSGKFFGGVFWKVFLGKFKPNFWKFHKIVGNSIFSLNRLYGVCTTYNTGIYEYVSHGFLWFQIEMIRLLSQESFSFWQVKLTFQNYFPKNLPILESAFRKYFRQVWKRVSKTTCRNDFPKTLFMCDMAFT